MGTLNDNDLELARALLDAENRQPHEWNGPPIPFTEYEHLPFPAEALPDWGCDYVKCLAIAFQVPLDLAGMICLAVLAAATSKKYTIEARDGWNEQLGLYIIALLETGNRKSGTLHEALAPIEHYERKLIEEKRPEYEKQKHELEMLTAMIEELKKAYIKAKNNSGGKKGQTGRPAEDLKRELDELIEEKSRTPEPIMPTILTGDATEEAMVVIAARNEGFMAHFSAEGELIANAAGRYNNSISKFEVLLKGYSGEPIKQDRIGRESQYVDNPRFTIANIVQPIVLKEVARKPEFENKGFLGRFLYASPVSLLGQRQVDAEPIPNIIKNRYWNGILKLLIDSWGESQEPTLLKLSADANTLLADFERDIEPKLGPIGELRSIVGWAAKLAGNIVRISGLLHLADHAGENEKPLEVPGETMERALLFAPYFINQTKITYALIDAADNEEISKARRVIRWITDNELKEFSRRDCQRALQSVFKNADEVKNVLKLLVEHEYIRETSDELLTGPGRKKSQVFKINPLMTQMTEMTKFIPEAHCVNSVQIVTKVTNLKSEIEPLPFFSDIGRCI
jgi:replicative DNA helicase